MKIKRTANLTIYCISIFTTIISTSCGSSIYWVLGNDEPPALTIVSSVPDAKVYIEGRYVGQTPYSFFDQTYARKITIKKDGYKKETIHPTKVRGLSYFNFFPSYTWIWGYFFDKKRDISVKYKYKYRNGFIYFELEKKKR